MSRQAELVTCHVHQKQVPRASANEHHISPQGAGGSDARTNLIWLCVNCHSILHRCEEMLAQGNDGAMRNLVGVSYPDSLKQQQRMHALVKEAAKAFLEAGESGFVKNEAMVAIPRLLFERIQMLASEVRDPKTGRKVGTARYIESVLTTHLQKRGVTPPKRDP